MFSHSHKKISHLEEDKVLYETTTQVGDLGEEDHITDITTALSIRVFIPFPETPPSLETCSSKEEDDDEVTTTTAKSRRCRQQEWENAYSSTKNRARVPGRHGAPSSRRDRGTHVATTCTGESTVSSNWAKREPIQGNITAVCERTISQAQVSCPPA